MSGNATGATQHYADGDPCYDTMGHYAGAIQHCIASHSAIAWVPKSGIADVHLRAHSEEGEVPVMAIMESTEEKIAAQSC